jgi:crotonobetainyl-CoA:carnitine CoA-transferase CaiB-like acyl-CoA transferase
MGMDSTGGPPLPLAGFRVLGFTRFLAGPYAAMVLADLGADAIEAVTVTKTAAEWIAVLDEAGIPAGRCSATTRPSRTSSSRPRDDRRDGSSPHGPGPRPRPARQVQPVTDQRLRPPAPWVGQHTGQVLREELGVSEAGLKDLVERGVAYNKHPEAAQ